MPLLAGKDLHGNKYYEHIIKEGIPKYVNVSIFFF